MKQLLLLTGAFLLSGLIARPVSAAPVETTISFNDTAHYWHLDNGPSDQYSWSQDGDVNTANDTGDDAKDKIGTPDIDSDFITFTPVAGQAVVDIDQTTGKGYLKKVEINYDMIGFFNVLGIGDLFVDDGADGTWDWVIASSQIGVGTATAAGGTSIDVHDFGATSFDLGTRPGGGINYSAAASTYDYVFSGQDNQDKSGSGWGGNWTGYGIRDDHPWKVHDDKVDASAVTHSSSAKVSGWTDSPNTPQTLTYDDIDVGLAGGQEGIELSLVNVGNQFVADFILGFSFNCGNEVLYEHLQVEGQNTEVPEPSSLFLMCTGLAALVGCGRQRWSV